MSSMLTRWALLETHDVTASDLDRAGAVADEAVERWMLGALFAYLDRCATLRRVQAECHAELRYKVTVLPDGSTLGRPASVIVTASATEVDANTITVSIRIRPCGAERGVADGRCTVQLEDATSAKLAIDDQIRDELILLERSATKLN